jgi:predicted transcriptional regulator
MDTITASLGEQELEVWRFIADHAPVSARDVAAQFAEQRGLARTTVLTVIERLRKKGYLARRRRAGVFHYTPRVPPTEVVQNLVRHFVEKTLAGSVSPVVAYLAKVDSISDDELAELQRVVEQLKAQREERP